MNDFDSNEELQKEIERAFLIYLSRRKKYVEMLDLQNEIAFYERVLREQELLKTSLEKVQRDKSIK